MRKRYKVINRTRFYLFIISVFVVISVVLFSLLSSNKAHSSAYNINYKEIEIVEGDTLWNIALNNLPERTDVRKMVYDITEINNLGKGHIHPGDRILVPIP